MIKCPKCGVETLVAKSDVNGIMVCAECWYKQRKELSLSTQEAKPTIAEKILDIYRIAETLTLEKFYEDIYVQLPSGIGKNFWFGSNIDAEYETFEEALNAAYEWAKEQEK